MCCVFFCNAVVGVFFNNLTEENSLRAGCLTLTVMFLSCGFLLSVSLPQRGIVGWSVVCDCSISCHTHLFF